MATVLAIHAEVAVERPDYAGGMNFRHANEAGIGEGHRSVGVAAHEGANGAVLGVEIEVAAEESRFDERENLFRFLSVAF